MVRLTDINPYIICFLCKGYIIDATTISECMHTFCKSCIVKEFIKNSACPQCGVGVNPTEPTKTLRSDNSLQDLINKVVPGLAQREILDRELFYRSRGEPIEESVKPSEDTLLKVSKKRPIYRAAVSLPVYVQLQHERSVAASSIRVKRYPGHMLRFNSDMSISSLKEYIRQKLSLSTTPPNLIHPKIIKEYERSKALALKNAPDVDILCGDYLLEDQVTLEMLFQINSEIVQNSILPLTYRFRGTFMSDDTTVQPLTVKRSDSKLKQRYCNWTSLLSDGKRKYFKSSTASPRRPIVIHKSPIVRKSIVIQKSAKPPRISGGTAIRALTSGVKPPAVTAFWGHFRSTNNKRPGPSGLPTSSSSPFQPPSLTPPASSSSSSASPSTPNGGVSTVGYVVQRGGSGAVTSGDTTPIHVVRARSKGVVLANRNVRMVNGTVQGKPRIVIGTVANAGVRKVLPGTDSTVVKIHKQLSSYRPGDTKR